MLVTQGTLVYFADYVTLIVSLMPANLALNACAKRETGHVIANLSVTLLTDLVASCSCNHVR
jgi:hypothetical protein